MNRPFPAEIVAHSKRDYNEDALLRESYAFKEGVELGGYPRVLRRSEGYAGSRILPSRR